MPRKSFRYSVIELNNLNENQRKKLPNQKSKTFWRWNSKQKPNTFEMVECFSCAKMLSWYFFSNTSFISFAVLLCFYFLIRKAKQKQIEIRGTTYLSASDKALEKIYALLFPERQSFSIDLWLLWSCVFLAKTWARRRTGAQRWVARRKPWAPSKRLCTKFSSCGKSSRIFWSEIVESFTSHSEFQRQYWAMCNANMHI